MVLLGWKPKDFDLRYGLLEVGDIHFWKDENFESTQSLLRVDSMTSPSRLKHIYRVDSGKPPSRLEKFGLVRKCVERWRKISFA